MNIRWRNGALGSMAVTMCTYPKNLEGSITILGETGTVRIGGMAVNEIQEWNFADERDYDRASKKPPTTKPLRFTASATRSTTKTLST